MSRARNSPPTEEPLSRSVEAQGLAALLNLDAHLEMSRISAATEQAAAASSSASAQGATELAGQVAAEKAGPALAPVHTRAVAAQPVSAVAGGAAPAVAPVGLGRIGPYELKAALPHDGLGQMFKAWDSTERIDVMLTLLDLESDARDREVIIKQLHQSVLAAATLQHPGLAHIHDAGVVGAGVYICNHWLPGRTLAHAQKAGWQPTARVAATMVRSLALALEHAHAHGVLHGGLNPSTVMLDAEDKPTVLGLGYACPAHASDLPSMDPLVRGAAPYLAPEQLQGGTVDARTDVHALGVLLYELLAGHRAYPGETVPEVARALMAHDPAPPHWLRLDVPERLSAIAMQALQRNPAARYAHAREVAQALSAWLEQVDQESDDARQAFVTAQTLPTTKPKAWLRKLHWTGAALLAAAAMAMVFTGRDKPEADVAAAGGATVAAPTDTATKQPAQDLGTTAPPSWAAPAAQPTGGDGSGGLQTAQGSTQGLTSRPPQAPSTTEGGLLLPQSLGKNGSSATMGRAGVAVPTGVAVLSGETVPSTVLAQAPPTQRPGPAASAEAPARPSAAQPKAGSRDKARPAAPEARAAAAPAAVQTGTVQLAVSPWGYVEVGGKPAGASPPLHKLTLPEGTHTITIRNEDFAPYVTTIHVTAAKAATVRHRFAQ